MVLHRCDNPPCVNPAHLFTGTARDNERDKHAKGRGATGERNGGGGKLTEDDIRSIRAALGAGETKTAIGMQFGVTRQEIGHIAAGRHWANIR